MISAMIFCLGEGSVLILLNKVDRSGRMGCGATRGISGMELEDSGGG